MKWTKIVEWQSSQRRIFLDQRNSLTIQHVRASQQFWQRLFLETLLWVYHLPGIMNWFLKRIYYFDFFPKKDVVICRGDWLNNECPHGKNRRYIWMDETYLRLFIAHLVCREDCHRIAAIFWAPLSMVLPTELLLFGVFAQDRYTFQFLGKHILFLSY